MARITDFDADTRDLLDAARCLDDGYLPDDHDALLMQGPRFCACLDRAQAHGLIAIQPNGLMSLTNAGRAALQPLPA